MIEFAGNSRITDTAEHFIAANHIPHAIIISGEEGTGRHTIANYIIAAALCSGSEKPCRKCRNCELLQSGNHPDVTIIAPEEKKKNISVKQIRDAREAAYIKPHTANRKVFIIDMAETLNEQAQNALLKILEEPPQAILFILITKSVSSLLETVRSRCVHLPLVEPDEDEALAYIKKHSGKDDDEILQLLKLNRNNIGFTLKALKQKQNSEENLALDFANALLTNTPTLNLLEMLVPFEKDRVKSSEFIADLKIELAKKMRANINNKYILKRISNMYNTVCECEPQLITNVNLSLFFSALVCALKQ